MCLLHQLDHSKAEAFAGKLLEVINHGTLSLMISVGHRTGLFDTMGQLAASTSDEIAGAAGLNERYVREWLGAMATSKIVTVDPEGKRYALPPEHAAFLTRAAGADNMAVFGQYISVLGSVEDHIVECFKNGGGVPYEAYNRFHEVMAEESGQTVLSSLLETILPLVPGIQKRLKEGIEVLDIGCGSGRALNLMAKTYPNSRFTGYDLCEEPIATATAEAAKQGLTNVQFKQRDLTDFKPEKQYDFITAFDAIHDQARPDKVLSGVYQALKPDGVFLVQDIDASSHVVNNMDHPIGPLLYTISTFHCMSVSLAQGGMGLGTVWGTEKAQEMFREAGFSDVKINRLEHDFQNCFYVIRK